MFKLFVIDSTNYYVVWPVR